jgi:hypothetical protein
VTAGPTTAITLTVPAAPDADWETVRSRMMAALAVAADGWTDQNLADPGVTLAEAAAFTLADLHRRIEQAGFDGWPIGWPAWLPDAQRHWHATLPAAPAADPGPLLAQTPLAEALAAVAEALEPVVRACPDRPAAARLLASPPWVAHVPTRLRDAVITTLRLGLVRRLAQDRADTVADAVGRADAAGGSRAQRDARAARELAADLAERAWLEPGRQDSAAAVWPEEVDALVARERRRLALDALAERATAVQAAATPQRRAAVVADLVAAGLSPAEAELASAGRRVPAGLLPEDLEAPDGQTLVWPPHPIQTLTCEPVVADDYARRARLHPGVRRAWAVPGRLAGVAWHGLPTPDPAGLAPGAPELAWAVDRAAAALTLVVEADAGRARAVPAPGAAHRHRRRGVQPVPGLAGRPRRRPAAPGDRRRGRGRPAAAGRGGRAGHPRRGAHRRRPGRRRRGRAADSRLLRRRPGTARARARPVGPGADRRAVATCAAAARRLGGRRTGAVQ